MSRPPSWDLGIHNEFVPDMVFDLRLVLLFVVEHFVIAFEPNGPKRNVTKEVPNFDLFAKLLQDPLPKQSLFPIAGPNPTQLMHDKHDPSPSPSRLNAIP